MKIIKHDLGADFSSIQIQNIGDFHIGDVNFDHKLAAETIKKIKETPNLFFTIHGDMINNAIRDSVSDIYSEELSPEDQIELLVDMFKPISHKLLGVTSGNHEWRTYKDTGIDVMRMFVKYLGLDDKEIYSPEQALVFVSFGKNKHRENVRHTVSLFVTHQGGTKARLTSLADIVDADILVRGHYHSPQVHKMDIFKTDTRYKTVKPHTQLFTQNGACLKYGGYGAMKGFRPTTSVFPIVEVSIVADGKDEILDLKASV